MKPEYSEGGDFVAAAKALQPLIEKHANDTEEQRSVAKPVIEALIDAHLLELFVPREVGGSETDAVSAHEVIEAISYADGSTGWSVMALSVSSGQSASQLPDDGVAELFRPGAQATVAGQGPPNGVAELADGGYRVTGNWNYGSGITHATWVFAGCGVVEDGKPVLDANGQPKLVFVVVPRQDIRLLDNWHVLGLEGTGSFDFAIEGIFVPDRLTHTPHLMVPRRGRLFRYGLVGVANLGHTAVALGVARRALDEIKALALAKHGPYGRIADFEPFLDSLGRAEAKLRAARALSIAAHAHCQDRIDAGETVTVDDLTLVRAATLQAHEAAADVGEFAHRAGGGVSLREGSLLNRCFRDIFGMTQHVVVGLHGFRDCGRGFLGDGDDLAWSMVGLR